MAEKNLSLTPDTHPLTTEVEKNPDLFLIHLQRFSTYPEDFDPVMLHSPPN